MIEIKKKLFRFPFQIASPACTEMEMKMMNWLGKMLKLPEHFLFSEDPNKESVGGGVIQVSTRRTSEEEEKGEGVRRKRRRRE